MTTTDQRADIAADDLFHDVPTLQRTTEEIYNLAQLREKLKSGRKLRIKYGVDVTAPFLHIGHAVNLWAMRELQEAGHKVVFLIGDFTTRIGDPTGKSKTRPKIPPEQIERDAEDFIKQVSRILRTEPDIFEIRRNSEWFGSMSVERFLELLSLSTHAKLIQRDMFQKRIKQNSEIYMHEMLYPILQGYDSVELDSDLTIVGTDQLFNELMGRLEFDEDAGRLELSVDYPRGSRFACPEPGCGRDRCPVHDTVDKTWRHLDFFEHKAFLRARLPRVRCPEHGVRLVSVPWARPGSGFTILFEALVLTFAKAMPMTRVAATVREHDTRVWRIVEHHVHIARARQDFSGVRRVGMDETAAHRGQDYVSLFADLDARRVLFATEGRDAGTVGRFAADLSAHGGDPGQVTTTSSDMSAAFIRGIGEHLPNAALTFDRYHLAAKLSEAVDAVRRAEVATRPELTHTRWLWLKNWANLSTAQRRELQRLLRPSAQLATARALRWREDFQAFYDQQPSYAPEYLRSWCSGAKRSRLQPIKDFVALVERHWDGILAWHHSHVANGLLEGTNSLIQAAKARARGYRSKDKMITIAYLIAGKLPLPTVTNPTPA